MVPCSVKLGKFFIRRPALQSVVLVVSEKGYLKLLRHKLGLGLRLLPPGHIIDTFRRAGLLLLLGTTDLFAEFVFVCLRGYFLLNLRDQGTFNALEFLVAQQSLGMHFSELTEPLVAGWSARSDQTAEFR